MKQVIIFAIVAAVVVFIINDYAMKFRAPTRPFRRRKCDKNGCGNFGASRAGGSRKHNGMDVLSEIGMPVYAPITGKVRTFKPYAGYDALDGVEISGSVYRIKVMYLFPAVQTGSTVQRGQLIGYAQSLQDKYSGIANHLHLEVYAGGIARNPTNFFPPDTVISV